MQTEESQKGQQHLVGVHGTPYSIFLRTPWSLGTLLSGYTANEQVKGRCVLPQEEPDRCN